ncbi:hypothetical protein [Methanosarcina mazei]|uniref:AbiTii domain-containing protein n=1 Tax=Methanosarcina mazei TaxID=2209 RepID=A0A6C0VJ95_METMZ|nr:hypothetical protein [Methanosarcina mazei]QIB91006.1 hypothetical protein FQU78_08005 [Methanosarcina mazei]
MDVVISDLIKFNETTIKELNDLLTSFYKNFSNINKIENSCFQKLIELSGAYCGFPFGHYTEVYYYTLKSPPFDKQFDVGVGSFGRQPDGWIQLTNQQKNKFEKELPNTGLMTDKLTKINVVLLPLIQEAIDRNFIIKTLDNFDEQYVELKELEGRWIYSPQEFIDKYSIRDVFTRDSSMISRYGYPYHSVLMATYDALFHSVRLVENKINSSSRVLRRINYALPFATVKGTGDDIINHTIQIGSYVQGNGNILSNTTSYANSGQMNLNIENKNEVEKSLQEFLRRLGETDELDKYQKDDIAEDTDKIINELSKPQESQDEGMIDHRVKKIWRSVKDVVALSASLVSIAKALGISLIV